ncbi:MAG: heavy metal translocating P-type ATPase [Muricomes sp.]
MKFIIKHEIKGRLRIHLMQSRMTFQEADTLHYYLSGLHQVKAAKVYERTADAAIEFEGDREELICLLKKYRYEDVEVPEGLIENSGRELNAKYQEKLIQSVIIRYARKFLLPYPVQAALVGFNSLKYLWKGLKVLSKGRLDVSVLDATAIGISVLRGDMDTAGSVMFLLGIGETLEEWTHKKSVGDLARSMSLDVKKVWLKTEEQEVLTDASEIVPGDMVVVHMGTIIPFDGVVTEGNGFVNQASMTGEGLPVRKEPGAYVYAGSVLEEGELVVQVKQTKGTTRFEKIVAMIEESEKLKSSAEGKAEHLADRLVPFTLAGTGLVWLFTRNTTKALSVLMVDFSCALKLSMPIAVLSAIREAGQKHITVKGGKYLEAAAEAETIVFDKTGTLTEARPTVKEVVAFEGRDADEMLRIAACLEEHFPHSMAKAVVKAAKVKGLVHEEMHAKVDYIVAHGISSSIDGQKVIIGSHHFVFEDEGCTVGEEDEDKFKQLSTEYSHLYLAIEQKLAAVICIEDPLREEAAEVIQALRDSGIKKVVMMTGDSRYAAAGIARRIGVDEYYYEVLPEDKASFIEKEKQAGRKVIMVGDGINDSPALSAADVGIAISDGAEIAREIADITIAADNLYELVTLRLLSKALMKRVHSNYRFIVGFNTGLIAFGIAGILMPATSALLHNLSTLAISLRSMQNLGCDDSKSVTLKRE